jgi:hypothetical protein
MESLGCPWVSDAWIPLLAEEGWHGVFYYVIHEGPEHGAPPTAEDARHMRTTLGIEHDLLYDPDGWFSMTCLFTTSATRLPYVLVVNPDNMRVWSSSVRWWDDLVVDSQFLLSVCEEGAAHDPGYRP